MSGPPGHVEFLIDHNRSLPLGLESLGVEVAVTKLDYGWDSRLELLFPNERELLTHVVTKRRREMVAGRVLAHLLMDRLGRGREPVLQRPDRSPVWPAAIRGSITHTDEQCAVALARAEDVLALGIDLEPRTGLEPTLWLQICHPAELEAAERSSDAATWVRWAFCAKEAFYKAQYPWTGRFLDHLDVLTLMDPDRRTYRVECRIDLGAAWPGIDAGTGLLACSETSLGAAWVIARQTH